MKILRTNIHTGTQKFLDRDGAIESLKNDKARFPEKLVKRIGDGVLLDHAHYWYRTVRDGDEPVALLG